MRLICKIKCEIIGLHNEEIKQHNEEVLTNDLFCYEINNDSENDQFHGKAIRSPFLKQIKAAARKEFFSKVK